MWSKSQYFGRRECMANIAKNAKGASNKMDEIKKTTAVGDGLFYANAGDYS
ncbi:hypothetical protein GCM10028827_39620 [Mucilaginibacter myungsuensis]